MGESESIVRAASNLRGRKNAPQKIPLPRERISFRDLAQLAYRRKIVAALVDRTGADESTAKRWLSRRSRPPANAVYAVLGDIFQQID